MTAACPRCATSVDDDARFCPTCGAILGEGGGDLIGQVLARKYKVIDMIGEGSMGRIYLAEHLGLEKRVALKVLHREVVLGPEGIQRFRREGVAAGKLSHPNAIEVYDFDVTEAGDAFMAMEFIEGRDLRQALEEDGAFDLEDAREIVIQALEALEVAHGLGIVHRDLKPENIMLVDSGRGPKIKVLDFGLSKLVDTRVEASLATVPGRIIGTPYYMAPEQSSGEEADARTDLYAMGVIFYELLAGQRPFTGRNLTELLYAQATQEVPSIEGLLEISGLPEWVDPFIERALERDRADRYQSAAEMAQDLIDESVEVRERAPIQERAPRPPRARKRTPKSAETSAKPRWWIPAAVGTVLLGGGGFALLSGGEGAGSVETSQSASAARLRLRPTATLTPAQVDYLRLLDDARSRVGAGEIAGANALIAVAMGRSGVDAEAYLIRAELYDAKGDQDSAAADLRKAIEMDPSYSEAMANLGWVELERGRADEASAQFQAALAADERCADALAGRGTLAAESGDTDGALTLLDRALEADNESWRSHLAMAELRTKTGDSSGAINAFVEARRIRPENERIVTGLAGAYLLADRSDDAIDLLRDLLERDSENKAARDALTAAYLETSRFGDIVSLLQPKIDRGDATPDERALLGLATFELGRPDEASAILEAAVEAGLTDVRPRALFAYILLDLGQPLEALKVATRAIDADETLADAHLYRGLALFQLERFDDATRSLRAAVTLDPTCAPAWFALADIGRNYVIGDPERIKTDLRTYLELGLQGIEIDPRAEDWYADYL